MDELELALGRRGSAHLASPWVRWWACPSHQQFHPRDAPLINNYRTQESMRAKNDAVGSIQRADSVDDLHSQDRKRATQARECNIDVLKNIIIQSFGLTSQRFYILEKSFIFAEFNSDSPKSNGSLHQFTKIPNQ